MYDTWTTATTAQLFNEKKILTIKWFYGRIYLQLEERLQNGIERVILIP